MQKSAMQGPGRVDSVPRKTDRETPALRLPTPPSDAGQGTSRSGLPQPPSASALRLPPTGAALSPPIASSSLPLPPSAASLQAPAAAILPLPPGHGPCMQNADMINLKEQLADKDFQLKILTASLRTVTDEGEELKAQLTQQQQTHAAELEARSQQHQAELSALRDTTCDKELAKQTIEAWEKHAKRIQDQLNVAQAQAQPQGLSSGSDASTKAELDSTKADLEAVRSELAAAQQKIASFEMVKAEDSTAGQQIAEAQRKASHLEADNKCRDAELASTQQELQDAQRQCQDFKQTSECLQSELQATQDRCQQLEGTCKEQEQGFDKKVLDMIKLVEEHAGQYVKDLQTRDKKIVDLKEQLQESGKHGYKRPRDHSNGRDSKRRS
ncbi:TPA: hypothetical protein ACH3X1_003229 [Trebouxia sp. C0004]